MSPSFFYLFSVLGKGQAKMSFKLQAVDMRLVGKSKWIKHRLLINDYWSQLKNKSDHFDINSVTHAKLYSYIYAYETSSKSPQIIRMFLSKRSKQLLKNAGQFVQLVFCLSRTTN